MGRENDAAGADDCAGPAPGTRPTFERASGRSPLATGGAASSPHHAEPRLSNRWLCYWDVLHLEAAWGWWRRARRAPANTLALGETVSSVTPRFQRQIEPLMTAS